MKRILFLLITLGLAAAGPAAAKTEPESTVTIAVLKVEKQASSNRPWSSPRLRRRHRLGGTQEVPAAAGQPRRHCQEEPQGLAAGHILFKRYYRESKWIKNPMSAEERKKLDQLVALFQKYSDQYGFDWLALGAQAYQESELNHNRRSRTGAASTPIAGSSTWRRWWPKGWAASRCATWPISTSTT
jgi:hypothetical protein